MTDLRSIYNDGDNADLETTDTLGRHIPEAPLDAHAARPAEEPPA